MTKIDSDTVKYYLPAKFQSSMSFSMHALHLFMIVFFGFAVFFVPDYEYPVAKDIFVVVFSSFMLVFSIVSWLYFGVLRLGTIEIDNYEIRIQTLFLNKNIRWQNIKHIEIVNGATVKGVSSKVLQITLIEGDGTESAWERLNAKFTSNRFVYGIPLDSFSNVNWNIFMRTINGIFETITPSAVSYDEEDISRR